ncbi:MAG: hypothetical protein Q9195_005884 [Heterodermia aff. obscurata]
MERESFESIEIARILNSSFIPIKIDREERPDIDAIYMNYVQATTGSGGWPLNVFLTPDLEPVFGGTYWPGPENSLTASMSDTISFLEILQKMSNVWYKQEGRCRESAKEITRQLREFADEGVLSYGRKASDEADSDGLEIDLLEDAYQHFQRKYDKVNGGFASAPKFPTPVILKFLLNLGQWSSIVKHIVGESECVYAAMMATHTLRNLARGGIRDQIGFGFSRYSVTADWSLPHFEKMLYDQGQLLDVYLDAFLINRDPEMLGAVYDIATYITSPPIAAPTGGFNCAEDADSYPSHSEKIKREGAYYVWSLKEFRTVLGDHDAEVCARFFGAKYDGNIEPENDPHDEFISLNVLKIASTPKTLAKEMGMTEEEVVIVLKEGRKKLREYRERERPRPALDDKIIVAWNGLAIGALARTSAVLEKIDPEKSKKCRLAAERAVAFIRKELFDADSKVLWRVYREGRGDAPGLCDDYAFFIHGLLDLYEATFDDQYLNLADTLQKTQLDLFLCPHGRGFYFTPSPHPPDLLLRLKNGMDSAEPSSNNISASNLHRLASMLDDEEYARHARETVAAFEAEIEQFPFTFTGMLGSVVKSKLGSKGAVITGFGNKEALAALRASIGPGRTVTRVGDGMGEWLRRRNLLVGALDNRRDGVFVCENKTCNEGLQHL